jgi:hypothetical protein
MEDGLSYKEFFFNRRWYGYSVNDGDNWLDRHSATFNLLKLGLWRWNLIEVSDNDGLPQERFSYTDQVYRPSEACWDGHCIF